MLERLSRPANGEVLGCGCAGCAPNDSPPKASLNPPKLDCWGDCCGGEARAPKEPCRACCWGAGAAAAGFDAYRDRMDCLRSGRDGAAAAGPVLEGRAGCAGVLPRKSKPNNESPAFACFGGAVSAFGGAALAAGGPVLGRGGAGVSSPKRSIAGWGGGGARAAGGWLELLARR